MKNEKKLILIEQIGMGLIAIIMVLSMVFLPQFINNIVYADFNEIVNTQYAVVNFNQLINTQLDYNNSTIDIGRNYFNCIFLFNESPWGSFTTYNSGVFDLILTASSDYTSTLRIKHGGQTQDLSIYTQNDFNIINGHKYYFRINVMSANPTVVDGLQVKDFIVVDISSMFGADNLPTIQQCRDLFVANYYPYNSGTPVSLNGLNSYAEGVASVYGNSVHLNEQYFYNNISEIRLNDVTGGYAKYINNNFTPTFSLNIDDHVIFNLPTTLIAGTLFKLSFYLGRSEYNDNTPLEIGYLIQGQFYSLTRVTATAQFDDYNYFELDLTAPYDINGIVFNIPRDYELTDPNYQWYSVHIGDINLTYYINNLQQLISESIEYGREKYKDELKSYYAIGGQGYEAIYQAGVRDSQSNMAVFTDSWAFIGTAFRSVGDLLKVELFPKVPIGLFVAFPLLLGLIYFIVKLTKGGS